MQPNIFNISTLIYDVIVVVFVLSNSLISGFIESDDVLCSLYKQVITSQVMATLLCKKPQSN